MLWLELSVVVIRKFPISSPDWTHDGDNSHENRKSQLRQGARLLFSLNGHVYLQLNNFHFAREQWSQSMPGQTRWILASLLLLSGTLPAAEHPTFNTALKWQSDLKAASAEARAEGKLLFVMHLSGNLAKSAFT